MNDPYSEASPPATIDRTATAFLAVPREPSVPQPPGGYPLVVALNGHDADGLRLFKNISSSPTHYFYGDAFASRGFAVLAVNVALPYGPDDVRRTDPTAHEMRDDVDQFADGVSSTLVTGWIGTGIVDGSDRFDHDTDWTADGQRAMDIIAAVRAVQQPHDWLIEFYDVNSDGDQYHRTILVDASCCLVTGLSLGGRMAAIAAALDTSVQLAVVAAPDTVQTFRELEGVLESSWDYADWVEYIHPADYHVLFAPSPLILECGQCDSVFLPVDQPVDMRVTPLHAEDASQGVYRAQFAPEKELARRVTVAYSDPGEADQFVNFVFSPGTHQYRFSDIARTLVNSPADFVHSGVYAPVIQPCAPTVLSPGVAPPVVVLPWQSDASVSPPVWRSLLAWLAASCRPYLFRALPHIDAPLGELFRRLALAPEAASPGAPSRGARVAAEIACLSGTLRLGPERLAKGQFRCGETGTARATGVADGGGAAQALIPTALMARHTASVTGQCVGHADPTRATCCQASTARCVTGP